METNLLGTIYMFGAFQSLLLVAAVKRKRSRRTQSNRLLVGLLLSIGLLLVHHGILTLLPESGFYYLMGLATAAWFAVPPFLYLFVLSLVKPQFRLRPIHLVYFIFAIYNIVQWGLHRLGLYWGLYLLFSSGETYTYAWVANYLLVGAFFSGWALLRLRKAVFAPKQQAHVKWLSWYLIAFLGSMVASGILLIFFISFETYTTSYEYGLLIVFEIFSLALVFKSLSFSSYFNQLSNDTYTLSQQQRQNLGEISQKLQAHMEKEKPYLRGDLKLSSLAGESGIPENTLSQVFSQHLKTNFYDFINAYRLLAFEEIIVDPKNRQYKIASLAEECGFGSKASFYKAFREKHQMTPTEYLKLQQ